MKKFISFILAAMLMVTLLAGCDDDEGSTGKKRDTGSSGYEEIVDIFVDMVTGRELSRAEARKMQPEAYLNYLEEEEGVDFSEYYEQVQKKVKSNANAMISYFGADYTVSYKIVEDRKMSNEEKREATKRFNEEIWYDAGEVKELREVVAEVTIVGEEETETVSLPMHLMQSGNNWYVIHGDDAEFEALMN